MLCFLSRCVDGGLEMGTVCYKVLAPDEPLDLDEPSTPLPTRQHYEVRTDTKYVGHPLPILSGAYQATGPPPHSLPTMPPWRPVLTRALFPLLFFASAFHIWVFVTINQFFVLRGRIANQGDSGASRRSRIAPISLGGLICTCGYAGEARYLSDVVLPQGGLHGVLLLSTHAHAKVLARRRPLRFLLLSLTLSLSLPSPSRAFPLALLRSGNSNAVD